MPSEIAILLQNFGSTIGLGSALDLSKDGTIRLNLAEDFGIDFEEDLNGKKVWIYCDLFPGVDKTQQEVLFQLLRLMFTHHRTSDAHLTIDPKGFAIMLVSSFSCDSTTAETQPPVERLDEHLKSFVALVETLRAAVNEK
ncbi:MAG: type III secretion system chaperone [Chthoniobacterales bacterium]|nr:type III secretion system chaperone [Chthoniobacterales bacterium]